MMQNIVVEFIVSKQWTGTKRQELFCHFCRSLKGDTGYIIKLLMSVSTGQCLECAMSNKATYSAQN